MSKYLFFTSLLCLLLVSFKNESGLSFTRVGAGDKQIGIRYENESGKVVTINTPLLEVDGKPVSLVLSDYHKKNDSLFITYSLRIPHGNKTFTGRLEYIYCLEPSEKLGIVQYSKLEMDSFLPLKLSLGESYILPFSAKSALIEDMELSGNTDKQGEEYTQPLSVIYTHGIRHYCFDEKPTYASYFEMGAFSTHKAGNRISMPVIGVSFAEDAKHDFAVLACDPYSGTQFYTTKDSKSKHSTIQAISSYNGELVPIKSEEKRKVFRFTDKQKDYFSTFYQTIPDVKASPEWIKKVGMAYYDYLSDDGQGWYRDIDKLVETFPKEHLDKIVLCVHGWYNNIGLYSYDFERKKLIDKWTAFANPSKNVYWTLTKNPTPMSIAEMHKRIEYAKDRGFKVILYFADGTNTTGPPVEFADDLFVYPDGTHKKGWEGPCGGGIALDPTSEKVHKFYLEYLKALLDEYASEIDGLVWDETNYFLTGDVSQRVLQKPQYADKAMMYLMADMTRLVQEYRKVNPNLVMLEGSHYFYGLVANGSFTDYPGLPTVINYRNISWTCSWDLPGVRNVHTFFRTRKDIKYPYGFEMGLTNGWQTDKGPSEMDQKTLLEVRDYFIKTVYQGDREEKVSFY